MKTIIINIFDSNVARNILRTNVFASLKKEKDLNIVILAPANKQENYSKEFSCENVKVDCLPNSKMTFGEVIAMSICKSSISTHTARQILEEGWNGEGRSRLDKYILGRVTIFLGKFILYRKLIRVILPIFFREEIFESLIKKYKPDLIFSPTIYSENDIRLLKCAKKNIIPTVGMIKSWDNLTSKDFLLVKPDFLIVHNEIVKNEAKKYGDYPLNKVFVSGIPQFDIYNDENFVLSRDVFFKKFGLDPNKKLIMYSAVGTWLFPREREMIEILAEIINSDKLNYPSQLLVRLHPAYLSEDESLRKIKNIFVHRPGKIDPNINNLRASWEFDKEETQVLASTIKWSDVTLNCGSTMTLESAYFDRPIISPSFDGKHGVDEYKKSVRRLYEREHCLPIKRSGGVRFPKNIDKLAEDIKVYLRDDSIDRKGREVIVREQCYKKDGKSGERIANFIIDLLKI